jgi:soluble lytic murein transglycosylase
MTRKLLAAILVVGCIILIINCKNILRSFFPVHYSKNVLEYSAKYELDPYLVYSIIKVESKFNPYAKSQKGAIGLMQITPQTGEYIAKLLNKSDYKEELLYNPDLNIEFGCYYFSKLYSDFDNNMDIALAAYNGGRGNVNKWIKTDDKGSKVLELDDIPFKETKGYIIKVKRNYKIYKFLYE